MSTPAIPTGYRRLRVGEKRPKGYCLLSVDGKTPMRCHKERVGEVITREDEAMCGPYIAPVRPRNGGKKGRAK
jgi:hypothetical protein